MNKASIKQITLPMLTAGMLITTTAFGQSSAIQLLDRVEAFDNTAVLEMNFDDPDEPDFTVLLNEAGADFKACKLTATRGIYCLDGDVVRNWPPGGGSGGSDLVYCDDPTLGLKKCTGLTVDLGGTIWLAGQDRGKTHNLFKIEPSIPESEGGPCSSGDPLMLTDYCATLWAADKPLLIDLKSIDGDAGASFALGKGVLGLEERKTAVFFPDDSPGDGTVIASGKRDWGLIGNEQLLSTALLQVVIDGGVENYVLVTTTKDRILLAETDGPPNAREVFDIAANRDISISDPSCMHSSDDPMYGVQSSPKSGITYVTDNQYCQVLALQPKINGGTLENLENVLDDDNDVTLSTGSFSVLGPTIAPGEIVDLTLCTDECTIINDQGGAPAATLESVNANGDTDMILFQIQGIPDCRYIPDFCVDLLDSVASADDLITEGIIIDRGGDHPAAQLLNVTPLLPLEVTEPFDGQLPDMWISSEYQAQEEKGFFFDAFFGVTGATFQGVFQIEVEVAALTTGYERGCFPALEDAPPPVNTPASDLIFGDPDNQEDTLGYDVAVKVSEDFRSIERDYIGYPVGHPDYEPDHEAMLINSSCGSSRGSGDRWSLIAFDLGFTPRTFDSVMDTVTPAPDDEVTTVDDAVFAKLLLSLFDDLEQSVNELACDAADEQTSQPLSIGQCTDFNQQFTNTLDKLGKCIDAAIFPAKESVLNQTCQAYSTQFSSLQTEVSSFTLSGEDPANRIGEAQVRMIVIDNVFTNLFFPSIPDGGFTGLSRN
mgnify:CR=1 FL=1